MCVPKQRVDSGSYRRTPKEDEAMARVCQRCSHHNEDHAKFCLSCGAMLEVQDEVGGGDPLIGKVLLGRYRPPSPRTESGR